MGDIENPLLSPLLRTTDPGTTMLMQQKLRAAEEEVKAAAVHRQYDRNSLSQMQILLQAGGGPILIFGPFGSTLPRYCKIIGPPLSRRFFLRFWKEEKEYRDQVDALDEIDIMKVHTVQADLQRNNVFTIGYFDNLR